MIKGESVASAKSCLGRFGVLAGQKREPIPPARMTTNESSSERFEDTLDSGNLFLSVWGLGKIVVGDFLCCYSDE